MTYEKTAEENLKQMIFPQTKKDDFEEFWSETIGFLRSKELKISRKKLDLPYDKTFITYEVQYTTHDDTVVSALYSVPNDGKSKHPCVVYFHGGGEKKEIHPDIVATGVCCFAIDVRSQEGTTVDRAIYNSDEICYPKYVYSAYEHCKSEKELVMVPYAPHCIPYSFKMKVFTEFAKMAEEV